MKYIKLLLILFLLFYSCGSLDPVNDYFGIKMNPEEEESFRIVSYNEEKGIKYQSSMSMDSDVNAWAEIGVEDFVVPGNRPELIKKIRKQIVATTAEPVFYAPGFIRQGGIIADAAKVAGSRWHAPPLPTPHGGYRSPRRPAQHHG